MRKISTAGDVGIYAASGVVSMTGNTIRVSGEMWAKGKKYSLGPTEIEVGSAPVYVRFSGGKLVWCVGEEFPDPDSALLAHWNGSELSIFEYLLETEPEITAPTERAESVQVEYFTDFDLVALLRDADPASVAAEKIRRMAERTLSRAAAVMPEYRQQNYTSFISAYQRRENPNPFDIAVLQYFPFCAEGLSIDQAHQLACARMAWLVAVRAEHDRQESEVVRLFSEGLQELGVRVSDPIFPSFPQI